MDEYRPRITDLPDDERPRERLLHVGASSVSTAELIAIILRVGTKSENVVVLAQRLLGKYKGLGGLARASTSELCDERGLGEAKAAQIKAALELGLRLLVESPDERPTITSPADAANLLLGEMSRMEQENMRVMLLDTRNRVQAIQTVYQGSLNTTMVRVGELFREAVRANCAAIIVAHNHPSGDPSPSPEDVAITREMVDAGKLLNIEVLDHLVIGHQRFVSLKERGLGFS
jgi:DNA repair protein RadC